jgi:hypothetical protein
MSKTMAILNRDNVIENIVVCDENEPQVRYKVNILENDVAIIGGKYIDGTFYFPSSDVIADKQNLLSMSETPPKPKEQL